MFTEYHVPAKSVVLTTVTNHVHFIDVVLVYDLLSHKDVIQSTLTT